MRYAMQSFNLHTKRIKSGIPNAAQLTESTAQIQTINQIYVHQQQISIQNYSSNLVKIEKIKQTYMVHTVQVSSVRISNYL